MTTRFPTMIVAVALLASCTGTTEPSVSNAPSATPPSDSPSASSEGTASIDLPWLPPQGVVVERNGGIVFVALDGRVLAKLHGFELMNPTEAPGAVLVRQDTAAFVLDATSSTLRAVDDARATHLRVADDAAIELPTPPGMIVGGHPSGHWRFALLSPDGNRILAQWLGECEVPVAYVATLQSGPPAPLTGDASAVLESFALGWTRGDRALAVLPGGACAAGARRPGVYAFDAPGSATLVTTLPPIGLARMWGSR